MSREDDFTVKTILLDLKDDIKDFKKDVKDDIGDLQDKWETVYNIAISQREVVKQLSLEMTKVSNVITIDTKDHPSLVNQVRDLSKEIPIIHSILDETKEEVNLLKSQVSPKEIRVEKWKILGAITVTSLTGFLAYLGLS